MQQEGIAHSAYSKALLSGAEIIPFVHFSEALDTLAQLCKQPMETPTYIFIYTGRYAPWGIVTGLHRHSLQTL